MFPSALLSRLKFRVRLQPASAGLPCQAPALAGVNAAKQHVVQPALAGFSFMALAISSIRNPNLLN